MLPDRREPDAAGGRGGGDPDAADRCGVSQDFTHFDASGQAAMVDVGAKPATERTATARARVAMRPETAALVRGGGGREGGVVGGGGGPGALAAGAAPATEPPGAPRP